MEGKRRSRGDGCLANSTNIHQSNSTSFPADRGEGEPTVSVYLKGHGWVCVCACALAGLRPSLFPKEVSLDNKHSHSSSPADLINKTSSSEYTLSLSPSLTHTDHLFHTLQVNTNSFQHMRWHAFMFAGERREEESWAYLLPVIAPSYDPPSPKFTTALTYLITQPQTLTCKQKKKNTHTPQSHTWIQSNITRLMPLLFILLYILAQWHFFIDISVSEGGSVLCEAKKVSFCRNNLKQQWNINFFCQFKCIKRNQSPIWHLKSSMKDKRWHVCSAVTDGKWLKSYSFFLW